MRTASIIVIVLAAAFVGVLLFLPRSERPAAAGVGTTDAPSAKPEPIELAFVQGGTIAMDLEAANYRVIPSADDHITISYRADRSTTEPRISTGVNGSNAKLHVITPPGGNIHLEIGVPAKSNLFIRQSAGNLDLEGIEGSKDCELSAGNLTIDVVDANQYGPVDGSVSSGNLEASAWSVHKGGLLRSFSTTGPGRYGLRAHVGAGNLTLTERSGLE